MRDKTMSKIDEEIEVESSDLEPMEESDSRNQDVVVHSQDDSTREEHKEDDYEYARASMRNVLADAQKAIGNIVEELEEGVTPRHYEVLSSLVKNTSEMSKDLLELHKQKDELEGKEQKQQNAHAIQNNYYDGGDKRTTQEIIDELKDEQDEK